MTLFVIPPIFISGLLWASEWRGNTGKKRNWVDLESVSGYNGGVAGEMGFAAVIWGGLG